MTTVVSCVMVLAAARPGGAKPTPCSGAFVVQGGPLLPGAPATQVDVIRLGGTPYVADLGIGCGPSALVGRVGVKATKRRTVVRAAWKNCAGLAGRVRLNGTIVESCGKLDATLRSKSVKRTLEALRSRCGDGVLDAATGEDCDLGSNCPNATPCPVDCHCATTTTTTIPTACNPLSAPGVQGCPVNQKCTWITLQTSPDSIGSLGCAPAGNLAEGVACTQGAPGADTGYDNCQTGLVCVNGFCADICGFDGSLAAACAVGSSCGRFAGLFANGFDDPVAGACQLGCDPLTQQRNNSTPCPGSQGCYPIASQTETVAFCTSAGTIGYGQQITAPAFVNACLPGLYPRHISDGSQTLECGGLCKPADVYQGNNVASESGVTPYTCEAKGAAAPSDPVNGESCRYWWALESAPPSAFSNTLGWCFKHAAFLYDSNGDQTPDAPFPRCVDLTTGDVVPPVSNPAVSDAEYFFCTAFTASNPLAASRASRRDPAPVAPPRLPTLIQGWR